MLPQETIRSQDASPLPLSPTRFHAVVQSPVPIRGRPCSTDLQALVERSARSAS